MNTTLQPECLQWARKRAWLDVAELAQKLGVTEDKVLAWEQSGELRFSLVEKLANATHTPLGYLFLPKPPVERLPVSDFRTVETHGISEPSPDLLDVVNDALRKQDWYRDYVLSMSEDELAFVGSESASDNVLDAADRIRSVVAWNADLRAAAKSWEAALAKQVDAVEQAGILVMRSGIVGNNTHRPLSVTEFRGFALSDKYAPLVFINAKDSKAAQIFTLAHELAHIWLGISGVSNLSQTYSPDVTSERFCNRVAAELLVPLAELKTQWELVKGNQDSVRRLVKHFKVSSLVILRRMRDAQYLSADEFTRLYADTLTQFYTSNAGGGDFYRTLGVRLGKRFASALIGSTLEGTTPYREAFQLLGVNNSEKIQKLAAVMETAV